MYAEILIATDGSECANDAADYAIAVATRFDATLHVLSVIDTRELGVTTPAEIEIDMLREPLRERSEIAVEDVLEKTRDEALTVVTEIVVGVPHRAICDYADANEIDLVVVGARGRSGVTRTLLGSVTSQVLQSAGAPVLAVQCDHRHSGEFSP